MKKQPKAFVPTRKQKKHAKQWAEREIAGKFWERLGPAIWLFNGELEIAVELNWDDMEDDTPLMINMYSMPRSNKDGVDFDTIYVLDLVDMAEIVAVVG